MAKDTKERILTAALDLFSHKGYEGTNIRELNGQQNAESVPETAETGTFLISISGHQAKGSVSFTRIHRKME